MDYVDVRGKPNSGGQFLSSSTTVVPFGLSPESAFPLSNPTPYSLDNLAWVSFRGVFDLDVEGQSDEEWQSRTIDLRLDATDVFSQAQSYDFIPDPLGSNQ